MELIISISVFTIIFLIVIGIYYLDKSRRDQHMSKIQKRLSTVSERTKNSQTIDIMRKRRKLSSIPWLDTLLSYIPFLEKLDRILQQSNLQYPIGVQISISVLMALFGFYGVSFAIQSLLLSVFAAIGLSTLPFFYVLMKRNNRIKKFEKQLPEALDMIARSLRAGHAFTSGLQMVAEEFDDPIGNEFSKVVDEINFGVGIKEALRNLAERINCADLSFFTVAVSIQRETGGDLAEILENISRLIRERFKLQARILTLSGEGRLSAKILLAIPFGLAFIFSWINPGYIDILIHDSIGQILIITSLIIMAVGVLIIRKLIAIKV